MHTLDDALAHVAAVRKTWPDARHVVFGLRIGHGAGRVDRSNDDGEPTRTGGYPLLQLLEGADINDALIVVVRYFGGIKLGTGGLARAYRQAGRLALEQAQPEVRYPEDIVELSVPYSVVGSVEHLLTQLEGVRADDQRFAADVTFVLAVRRVDSTDVRQRLSVLLQRHPDKLFVGEC